MKKNFRNEFPLYNTIIVAFPNNCWELDWYTLFSENFVINLYNN